MHPHWLLSFPSLSVGQRGPRLEAKVATHWTQNEGFQDSGAGGVASRTAGAPACGLRQESGLQCQLKHLATQVET